MDVPGGVSAALWGCDQLVACAASVITLADDCPPALATGGCERGLAGRHSGPEWRRSESSERDTLVRRLLAWRSGRVARS
jgi:hypothetical protein